MAKGTITRTAMLNLLQRTGERVGKDVRAAVPDRQIVAPRGMSPAQAARMAGPPAITHEQLVAACAVTAGVVLGQVLDVLGVEIVDDDPPAPPTPPRLVQ